MSNIGRLQERLKTADGACALVNHDVTRRFLTGMKSSAGTVLVFPDAAYLIIDFRYIEKARAVVKDCEVILQQNGTGLYSQINELCRRHGAKSVMIDAKNTTIADYKALSKRLETKLDPEDSLSKILSSLRVSKSPYELEKMIAAQRIAEQGLKHIYEFIRPGMTERQVQLELDYYMLSHGAEALSFDTIALSGVNTSMPHGVPSDKKIERGEFVLLDFGAVVDGYHSDMTRTFCIGEPTAKMREVYGIVLEAQRLGLAAVKAGITGKELDAVARDYIASKGYGAEFGHSLGHGVGLDIHEAPTASASSEETLAENMVVTVEPGIYIEGEFGVRIEDFVIVKENGCVNMTEAEKELKIIDA
ncbi:MAG: aminopeptidase P family protein [Ruminococcus sp.]|nr:aminopeptidase P family protein [Ruminococcus sp.]